MQLTFSSGDQVGKTVAIIIGLIVGVALIIVLAAFLRKAGNSGHSHPPAQSDLYMHLVSILSSSSNPLTCVVLVHLQVKTKLKWR